MRRRATHWRSLGVALLVVMAATNAAHGKETGRWAPKYDRYITESACGTQVDHHFAVNFRLDVERETMDWFKDGILRITESGRDPEVFHIETDGFYYAENLFDKNRHYERAELICEAGTCELGLIYYPHERGGSLGRVSDFRVEIVTADYQLDTMVPSVAIPARDVVFKQAYHDMKIQIDWQARSISIKEVAGAGSSSVDLLVHLEDADGWKEIPFDNIDPGAKENIVVTYRPPLNYIGALIDTPTTSTESKLVVWDRRNVTFTRCLDSVDAVVGDEML